MIKPSPVVFSPISDSTKTTNATVSSVSYGDITGKELQVNTDACGHNHMVYQLTLYTGY